MAPLQPPMASLEDVPMPIRNLCGDVVELMRYFTFCHVLDEDGHLDNYMDSSADFAEVEEGLWDRVFNPTDESTWDSSLPVPDLNLPDVPSHFDLRVHAGALMLDAPPLSTAHCRSPWDLGNSDSPVNEARRHGQPVYLEPRCDPKCDDKIQWLWVDKDGHPVDHRLTVLHAVNDKHLIFRFHRDSVAHRDLKIFYHAVRHNTELGAYLIRRRLSALVAQDLPPGSTPTLPAEVSGHHFISPMPLAGMFRRECMAQPNPDTEAQVRADSAQVLVRYFVRLLDEP